MTSSLYVQRRKKVGTALRDDSMLILFSGQSPTKSHDGEYQFHPNRNFFYLTGLDRQHMALILQKQGEVVTETLLIERPDPDQEKWTGYRMQPDQARKISEVENVQFTDELEGYLGRQLYFGRFRQLYLDFERLHWDADDAKATLFAHDVARRYPYLTIDNIHPVLAGLRTVKSDVEVANVKKAIELTYQGIDNLIRNAKPGMKEYQLQAYYDFVLGFNGEREPAFDSIVASGKNAVVLHYIENNATVQDGDLVLLDMGAQFDYYSGDISRTFPSNGKFTDRQKEIYNIVLKAELDVIDYVKPGLTLADLNNKTKEILGSELRRIGLIQDDAEIGKYYYHGVSHHLGLDTHDACDNSAKLQPGMVITVEPGLYIAEEGIGIRIEDDVLVTESGCEVLSAQIPKIAEDVERWVTEGQA